MSVRIRWRNLELPLRVRVDTDTLTDSYGSFVAEPFQRGYGTTIGNALKRVLLCSLEGAGICSYRVKGMKSGATDIPHLAEDVDHFGVNLKRLRVRLNDGAAEAVFSSEIEGKEQIFGGDLSANGSGDILNPEVVIGNVQDKAKLGLDVRVRRGRGYQVASELDLGEATGNEIPVDAFFSPVRRVEYKIESTRVGKMTNYDKLIIQIWTNGVVGPEDALVEAGLLLQKHLNPLVQQIETGLEVPVEEHPEPGAPELSEPESAGQEVLDIPVSSLDLSVRAHNCIVSAEISSVGELVSRSESELLKIRNFGKTSLKEIRKKLGDLGLNFKDDGIDIDLIGADDNEGALDDDDVDLDDEGFQHAELDDSDFDPMPEEADVAQLDVSEPERAKVEEADVDDQDVTAADLEENEDQEPGVGDIDLPFEDTPDRPEE